VWEVQIFGNDGNKNFIHEEIKSRLNSKTACYRSFQNYFRLLSRNVRIKIYKTVIVRVLYGCETWPLTLRDEYGLVFENRVRSRIFEPMRDEVTGGWRILHNEELHDLYASPYTIRIVISRRVRWVGHVASIGEMRNTKFWLESLHYTSLDFGLNIVNYL
jgi:hypothetical protein